MNGKLCRPGIGLSLRLMAVAGAALLLLAGSSQAVDFNEFTPGVAYAHDTVASVPWSIHLVRVDRSRRELELQSAHAMNRALGLAQVSEQVRALKPEAGVAVAAVNGDFYIRDRAYAGDPRGLQIVDGEMISAPSDTATFWIDAAGAPHGDKTESRLAVTWTDGASVSFGLNEDRTTNVVLYTPSIGLSTHTRIGGRELVLENAGGSAWLPLKAGESYSARVREVRESGDTRMSPDIMVLSLPASLAQSLPALKAGDTLKISTAILPEVRGARTALSGGPMLVHGNKKQDWLAGAKVVGPTGAFSVRSMSEQHPRTALGWNDRYFYLIEVDGRQISSRGMKLDEVAEYLMKLGCTEVMNLDGGGSASLWANGRLMNSPSDPVGERMVANSLLVVRKKMSAPGSTGARAETGAK